MILEDESVDFETFSLLADLLRNVDLFLVAWVRKNAFSRPKIVNLPFGVDVGAVRDEMKNMDVLHSCVPRILRREEQK